MSAGLGLQGGNGPGSGMEPPGVRSPCCGTGCRHPEHVYREKSREQHSGASHTGRVEEQDKVQEAGPGPACSQDTGNSSSRG